MQIFHALSAIVSGLGGGVTGALQDRTQRRRGGGSQQLSQERRLIESALAFPGWVKRNRNDDVEVPAAEARIAQGFAKPSGHGIAKVTLLCVFEFVHQFANQPAAAVGCDGTIEMQDAMFAIRATEALGDRAWKGFRAFRAERRYDPRRATLAIRAEVFRALDIRRANNTCRRIEKRRQSVKKFRYRECRHILTTP